MSCHCGTKIANDGLVFAYDMTNTQKSFKGVPTTNLATGQTLLNHSLVTPPTFSDAPEKGVGWKKAIVTATSSNFRMLKMDAFSVAANSTTTYSIEFECNSPEVYLNIDGTGFGGGTWTKIGTTRYSRTVTTASAGQAYLFINSNSLNASVNYIIYYKEYQIENNSFATPYVNGTRTNTQSILDLTGDNTITTNSLTYASDNTFSFNGTNNYVTLPPIVTTTLNGSTWTYAGWLYSNNNAVGGAFLGPKGLTKGRCSISVVWTSAGIISFANEMVATVANTSVSFNNNEKFYLCYSYDGTHIRTYKNGALVGGPTAYTFTGDCTGPYTISSSSGSYVWNGAIYNLKVYNRALTAAEVKQNFNAARSRYGI